MSNKHTAYQSYETISTWFDEHRSRDLFEKEWLDKAIGLPPKRATVLDLGCGMGEPIIPYLIEQGFEVTGIDGSNKLLDLARVRFPQTRFILGDMRNFNLKEQFDLIIAWHSLFHLPHEDQRTMFNIFAMHLKDGGALLFTTGSEAGEVWSDNGGEDLYHASLSPDEYKQLLKSHGFELIAHQVEDEQCGGATVWLARH
ncbi:MAG: class I SAM-dependent DNA methyltransferase [Chthoniobacterales bacterium]